MHAPWKKSYDQCRQHIKKQTHYFTNRGLSRESYGFSSSHIWCEIWTMKNAECPKIDVFELWCLRRLLRVPWTAEKSNQSILKGIFPEYSLEGLMAEAEAPIRGHLMWRTDSLEKALMLGKIEGRGKRGQQRMRLLDGITDWRTWVWASSGSWWWIGNPGTLQSIGLQRVGRNWVTELNWSSFTLVNPKK